VIFGSKLARSRRRHGGQQQQRQQHQRHKQRLSLATEQRLERRSAIESGSGWRDRFSGLVLRITCLRLLLLFGPGLGPEGAS
jgi:hypothetical protein